MTMNQESIREVARFEYFSCANEPTVTFKFPTVKFSAACLKKLAGFDYVHFIIDRSDKKLIIEPCYSDERNAIRWSSLNLEKSKAKTITCREFYKRIRELMMWSNYCRYKAFGKIAKDENKEIIVFDLKSAIIYKPNAEGIISKTPDYPQEWGDDFGESVERHKNNPLVRRFTEDVELIINQNNDISMEAENGQ